MEVTPDSRLIPSRSYPDMMVSLTKCNAVYMGLTFHSQNPSGPLLPMSLSSRLALFPRILRLPLRLALQSLRSRRNPWMTIGLAYWEDGKVRTGKKSTATDMKRQLDAS